MAKGRGKKRMGSQLGGTWNVFEVRVHSLSKPLEMVDSHLCAICAWKLSTFPNSTGWCVMQEKCPPWHLGSFFFLFKKCFYTLTRVPENAVDWCVLYFLTNVCFAQGAKFYLLGKGEIDFWPHSWVRFSFRGVLYYKTVPVEKKKNRGCASTQP